MEPIDRILKRLSLRDLRIVVAVAKAGSMGKAALQLAISQPVVSKAVSDLERELGLTLFERTPAGVQPTAYGQALIRCSTVVFDDIRQGLMEIQFLSDPTIGELSVGCTEPLAAGFVPHVIQHLSRTSPRITFNVIPADSITLRNRELSERTIELAIALMGSSDADIDEQFLFDDRFVILAGRQSPWTRRRRIVLSDLVHEQWVLPPAGAQALATAFRKLGLEPPRPHILSFSIPLHQHLLATGQYISALPISMLRFGKTLPGTPLGVKLPTISRPVGILTLKNRSIGPIARNFIEAARLLAKQIAQRSKRQLSY
jgi:DNA-binding transcriptional LysR family regulator